MILEREQINRYMRHIIMPEIGGVGQKKLLESSVLVNCSSISKCSFMLYYLAAMGIGKISCCTTDFTGCDNIAKSLNELNPELLFETVATHNTLALEYDAAIIFGPYIEQLPQIVFQKPVIAAATIGSYGILKTYNSDVSAEILGKDINNLFANYKDRKDKSIYDFPCACLMGCLAAVEVVKAILNIGHACENPLYIDLESYEVSYGAMIDISDINQQSDIDSHQLKNAKALIIGSGGLGSPVAYILAQMGIGKIGLIDYDKVEVSNLNRQILHSTAKLGMPKVKSAELFLRALNPAVEIETFVESFSASNAEKLISDYDIIIDGLDNLPTRYLLNDICYFMNKPLVEAGVLGFNGLSTLILPNQGPCYRCTFPESTDNSPIPSCSETGVLGAVPGVMGTIQALEVIKQLTGRGKTLLNKIFLFDALSMELTVLDIYKESACQLCGSNPTIDSLKDYQFICNKK